MKKVLSVLLILAGLLGFYGGAVTLQDASSAKTYWEDKGETALNNLDKLDDGMDQLSENTQTYKDGLVQLAQGEADYAAAPAKLAAGKKALAAGKNTVDGLGPLIDAMDAVAANYPTYKNGIKQVKDGMKQLSEALKENGATLKQLGLFMDSSTASALNNEIDTIAANNQSIEDFTKTASGLVGHVKTAQSSAMSLTKGVRKLASDLEELIGKLRKGKIEIGGITKLLKNNKSTLDGAINMIVNAVKSNQIESLLSQMNTGDKSEEQVACLGDKLVSLLRDVADTLDSSVNDPKIGELKAGVATLEDGVKQLKAGQNGNPKGKTQGEKLGIAGALKTIYKGILGSTDVLVPAIRAKSPESLDSMKYYLGKTKAGDVLGNADLAGFAKVAKEALDVNAKLLPGFKSSYADGVVKVANGEIELAKGLADYAAAPAKLEDGRKQLAVYEDGVKQVRDGFDTLMSEAGEGGVTSIADRVGTDEDFSLEDGSLDFDAGYAATTHGREYVDELSGVVTKELMGRIIGFGIGIFGGVLALVAAILALRKKFKGAGVCGLIAAVAAGVGAFVANNAGMELSEVAGSTVGKTPLLALVVLGVVALISAIAYLTAPKAE